MIGDLHYADEATFKRLLLFDFFRGMDSTGLAAIRNNNQTVISKVDSNPIVLFDMKCFEKSLNFYNSKGFIGHNRAATIGGVTIANAHPFKFEHITGAHNGTLDKESYKYLEDILGGDYGSDSMALFAAIAEYGVEHVIPDIEGAWALTWYDAKKDTFNVLKNDQRPLYLAASEDFKQVMWASEWPTLEGAFKTGGGDYKLLSDSEGHTYFPVRNNHLYEFPVGKIVAGNPFDHVDDFITKEIKGKEPKKVVVPAGGNSGNPFKKTNTSTTTARGTTGSSNDDDNKFDVITIISSDPYKDYLTKKEFDRIAKYGCTWCSQDVDIEDEGIKIWKDAEVVLCKSCVSGDDANLPSTLYVSDMSRNGVVCN
jgi:hypothetical protein